MFLDAELHAAYRIGNAPILNFPFPHFYVENIFPDDFYSMIQKNLPAINEMVSMADHDTNNWGLASYKDRFVLDFAREDLMKKVEKDKKEFLDSLGKIFTQSNFSNLLQAKFKRFLDMRFQYLDNVSFKHDLKLVNDKQNYALGPHTDKPSKVISVLFYLPKDLTHQGTGTSIYIPKDPNSLDKELPDKHYPRDDFHKIMTMPFVPNSAFCFIKTNNSYHGVEKLEVKETDRWSLQYNLYLTDVSLEEERIAKNKHQKENSSVPETPQSKFSI
ncbi:hypothetical protein OAI28_00555 [Methylophilaceae bacterium]|nr:hypothetical protein [Methylophilaceae bacterium]|tara:strand:- start:31 stop:849 length:819 start_codon:yes stop_codon:yes gene_type:complete